MKFGTWNIQGIAPKYIEVFEQLTKFRVDVCALTETKKKGMGMEIRGDYVHIYSGVPKEKRAKAGISIAIHKRYKMFIKDWESVNERIIKVRIQVFNRNLQVIGIYAPTDDSNQAIKDDFEALVIEVLSSIGNNAEIILLGDFNGRTGYKINDLVVGKYGEEIINDNGNRLIGICESLSLRILNGFFPHKDIHKYTWNQPTKKLKSVIDYIILRQNTSIKVYDVRVYRGAECGSDHFLLRADFIFPYLRTKNGIQKKEESFIKDKQENYKIELLKDESVSFLYKLRLSQKIQLGRTGTVNERYEWLKMCVVEAAYESLGKKDEITVKQKNKWYTEEVGNIISDKRVAYQKWLSTGDPEDRKIYTQIRTEVKKKILRAKENLWQRRCEEVENKIGGSRAKEAWRFLAEMRQNKQEKCRIPLIEMDKWKEYFQNLLQEKRDEYIKTINNGLPSQEKVSDITMAELENELRQMQNGKAPGPGGIPIELIKHSPSQVKEKLLEIYNDCLQGRYEIPKEWRYAMITPIFKKGDKKCCESYRGISVTSSIGRLYGRIIKSRIEKEWSDLEEQSGFRAGRSCTDNIFCLRNLIEKRYAKNMETHLVFIDLRKAYDTVPRTKMMEVLEQTEINTKYTNTIRSLYVNTKSSVKVGHQISPEFETTKGLLQGCCLSPTLFKIYISYALNYWSRKCQAMGIKIDTSYIYTLLFADDQVVLASDADDANYMVRKLHEEYKKWGLEINFEKTEYLVVGSKGDDLYMDKNIIRVCREFRYLGSIFTQSPTCDKDIEHRIHQGRKAVQQLNGVWWSKGLKNNTKKRIYYSIVEGIVLYNAEVWDVSKKQEKQLRSLEMDVMRRSSRISRLQHIPNTIIKEKMGMHEDIVDRIEERRLMWYGHLLRMERERWPLKIWNWDPPGRRRRGRPRRTWSQGVEEAMVGRQLCPEDVFDRATWRAGCGKRQ